VEAETLREASNKNKNSIGSNTTNTNTPLGKSGQVEEDGAFAGWDKK